MRKTAVFLIFMIFFAIFSGCEHTKYVDSMEYVKENEPNESTFQALEIEEGTPYSGEIAKPENDTADTDLYKIWLPSGTLISFEFESREENFEPYIGHTDNLGNYSFVIFSQNVNKHRATFVTTADGWQYFEIGDKRNTYDTEDPAAKTLFGGFKYWFRVISSHICNKEDYQKIKSNSTLKRNFAQNGEHIDILEAELDSNGIYQFNIDTENTLSDKFSFIMNCGSREIVAGNDDEDYYRNKIDPLIYTRLEKNLRHLLVTGRILLDLDETETENFTVSMKKQDDSAELEPNDTYNYANIVGTAAVSGYMETEKTDIMGEITDDEDWFRFEVEKGEIMNIKITPETAEAFIAEIWASSYTITGSGLIPMRASRLSGIETHMMNMLVPFNGQLYLDLIGSGIRYSFETEKSSRPDSFDSEESPLETEIPDCGWKFYKWKFSGEENDLAEITVSIPENIAGLYVFDSDYLPYAEPEPAGTTRFFVRKYEKTENLVFGIYIGKCEQNSGEKLTLSVTESQNQPEKWTHGTDKNPIKIEAGKAYQGFFDTNSGFYENFFEFTPEKDGTAYIMTSPHRESTWFNIDTVMTLLHDGAETASSDDMLKAVHFNKYSFISHEVKKGEKYTIKITPFMSESSEISAMNIKGSYILDLYLK